MHGLIRWGCLLATVAMTSLGCSSEPTGFALEGTAWRLVSIQSMDDKQGTTTVQDPTKYTVEFGADGQASFQIDCNRGRGTWQAEAAGGDSGKLTFGPIATTRMACAPPTIDSQVSSALVNVRGYRVIDGRLHMSLLADGGILDWERQP